MEILTYIGVNKLLECISSEIRKARKIEKIKRKAEAKAYEVKVISEEISKAPVPIKYHSDDLTIDSSDVHEILKRTHQQFLDQEIIQKHNIDEIVLKTYKILENIIYVSNGSVSPDWICRFVSSVENIGDKELQDVWARILAGEIQNPNSYSYRALEVLKNMTRQEVDQLQKLASFSMGSEEIQFIFDDDIILSKYGIKFNDILILEECGLINSSSLEVSKEVLGQSGIFYNSEIIGLIKSKPNAVAKNVLHVPVYTFTRTGKQLLSVMTPNYVEEYFIDCMRVIKEKHSSLDVKVHRMTKTNDNEYKIHYDEDLLS